MNPSHVPDRPSRLVVGVTAGGRLSHRVATRIDKHISKGVEVASNPDCLPQYGSFITLTNDYEHQFRVLVDRYHTPLYRFIFRRIGNPDDAADLTQHAFVEAACSIKRFRGESQLSTWLFGIAMNAIRNYLNRSPHRTHTFVSDDILDSFAASESGPEDQMAAKQQMSLLQALLDKMPHGNRRAFLMVVVCGQSYEEVSAELSIPIGTVRSRVSRARSTLKTQLEEPPG
jgi:RNA polymerase sigma factor (sigma-70 family)